MIDITIEGVVSMKPKNIEILCPMVKAIVKINSEILDDAGQFTKFILWTIGSGYTVENIDSIIELGEYVIQEELLYLTQIGFLVKDHDKYLLSDNGKSYLNLISTVEKINSMNIPVHINCYTGEVMGLITNTYSLENSPDIQKLPDIIARQFFYNKDYANSKEYLLKNYMDLFENINEGQKESLYTEIISERTVEYILLRLDDIPSVTENSWLITSDTSAVILRHTIANISFKVVDERLNNYRNVLETLSLLKMFDEALLSQKAAEIIVWKNNEIIANKTMKGIFLDLATNELLNNIEKHHIKGTYSIIQLPKHYEVEDIDLEEMPHFLHIKEDVFTIEKCRVNLEEHLQLIPFNLFKYEGCRTNEK